MQIRPLASLPQQLNLEPLRDRIDRALIRVVDPCGAEIYSPAPAPICPRSRDAERLAADTVFGFEDQDTRGGEKGVEGAGGAEAGEAGADDGEVV